MLNFEPNERSHNLLPLVVYLPLIVLFMAFAAVLSWPMPELAFRSDSSPVSWLSSAQLWAMVVLSIRLSLDRALPLLLGIWFALCRFYWVIEFPTLMVCIVGFLTTLWLHASVSHGLARWQLWVAIGIGLFSLSMDLLHFSNELAPYEEGFEVLAEAFYMSFLLGLRPAKNGSQVENEK